MHTKKMSKPSQKFCLFENKFGLDSTQSFGIKAFSCNSQDVHSYLKGSTHVNI